MEQFKEEMLKEMPADNRPDHSKIQMLKSDIDELVDEINGLQKMSAELKSTIPQLAHQLHAMSIRRSSHKLSAEELSCLENKVRLLGRATGIKFASPNAGVMMHKGKAHNFTIPDNQSKQVTVDTMWKYIGAGNKNSS